ncbi:hypothetical protein [Acidocella facilis]|uniref:hypothetical protein n=2 Tax=Acidocella facilis TaxID=525 RepID=UPI001F24707F|nr:hypothetical protein [Acidocella facilis]
MRGIFMVGRHLCFAICLGLLAGPALAQSSGIVGADRDPSCQAVGGIGSYTDCRRNGVQIDPSSGLALNAQDQCNSVGGVNDGQGCYRDNVQVNPLTGMKAQPSDPGYVPQGGQGLPGLPGEGSN